MLHNGPQFQLPTWCARLRLDHFRSASQSRSSAADVEDLGPLKILDTDPGCERFNDKTTGLTTLFEGYLFDDQPSAADGSRGVEGRHGRHIANLYQRHGRELFDHIEGAYLIAVLDTRAKRFIVGRDGMGKHPLYYVQRPGELWFASNIFALVRHIPVSFQPNRLSLALRLLGRWPQAGQTFFEGIRRVRPGHFLDVDSTGDVRERIHWHPLPDDEEEPWLPDAEARESFEPMLQQAVNRCLGMGAQGVMLSGGIDSVSIAALASREAKHRGRPPLFAYSARNPPGDPTEPEEAMQDRVVRALGMPHRTSTIKDWLGSRSLLSATLERVPELPAPTDVWWTGAYMTFYGTPLADGVHTLLTGSGGDEWLGVSRSHAADLLRRCRCRRPSRVRAGNRRDGGILGSRILATGLVEERTRLDGWWVLDEVGARLKSGVPSSATSKAGPGLVVPGATAGGRACRSDQCTRSRATRG